LGLSTGCLTLLKTRTMNIEPLQRTILNKVEDTAREIFEDILTKDSLDRVLETLELSILNGFMAHGFPAPKLEKKHTAV